MLADLAESQPNILAFAARVSDAAVVCASRVVATHPGAPTLSMAELERAAPSTRLPELPADAGEDSRRVAALVAGALEAARLPSWVARLPGWLRPKRPPPSDPAADFPRRISWKLWAIGTLFCVGVYWFNFGYVHVIADTRLCRLRLDDPLFKLVTHDDRWTFVTITLYTWTNLLFSMIMLAQAIAYDGRPLIRYYGFALPILCLLRDVGILLVPLCRANRAVNTAILDHVPYLSLGFTKIPWRPFASNDLLVSGHVGEWLLMLRATRSWPTVLRVGLAISIPLQIFGLMHTWGHYTIDMVLAVPIAFFADAVAVRILAFATRTRPARAFSMSSSMYGRVGTNG